MKKYLFLTCLLLVSQIHAQGDFELEKSVDGTSSKIYTEDRKLLDDLSAIEKQEMELKDIDVDTFVNFEKEIFALDNISYDFNNKYDFLNENLGQKDSFARAKQGSNNFYFGLSSYDKLDGLEYGLEYLNKYEGLEYKANIERKVRGEERKNTDKGMDKFHLDLAYDNIKGQFKVDRLDENYGGMKNSTSQVEASRKLLELEGIFEYTVLDTAQENYKVNAEIYYADSDSVSLSTSPYTREWTNTAINLYGTYAKMLNTEASSHLLEGKIGYLYDGMYKGKSGTLYLEGKDRFRISALNDIDFRSHFAIESSSKETSSDEFNFSAGLSARKQIDNHLTLFGSLAKDNRNKQARDIRNNFEYTSDILAFNDLKTEDNYIINAGASYLLDNIFVETSASLIRSKDKLFYQQVESDTGKEYSITPSSYNKTLTWTELALRATYTFDENLRTEAVIDYNSQDKLSYIPNIKSALSAVYNFDKYEARANFRYNGDMYANINKQNKLDSYTAFDLITTYNFNSNMSGVFAIENIFDTNKEVLTNYPVDSRKFTLKINMKF